MDASLFGAFIQRCRKDLGITQSELGSRLNVTDKAISRWERGVGFPDIKLLEPLADALQISVQELMCCERMKTEQNSTEDTKNAVEILSKTSKILWIVKCRRIIAIVCFFVYTFLYVLSNNLRLTEQLIWISPLRKVLFPVLIVAFLFASYREGDNGTT